MTAVPVPGVPAGRPDPDLAEREMRKFAAHWESAGDLQAFADSEPYWRCAKHAAALLAEYQRRGRVVQAAEALVEHDAAKPGLGKDITAWRVRRRELFSALADALAAARQEGTPDEAQNDA